MLLPKVAALVACLAGAPAFAGIQLIEKVLPERIYYVWAGQIADTDVAGHVKLAEWCRTQGLFRQAWRQYVAAAEADEEFKKTMPSIEAAMSEEAATWHFEQAEQAMRDGDLRLKLFKVGQLVEPPSILFDDAEVMGKVNRFLQEQASQQ